MYRILIVEDDSVIAAAVEKSLVSWGYDVKSVTDFRKVISDFTEFSPQLILLDISLPFFNGYHWCNEIRRLSSVPIIIISSSSDNMNIVMAMNMGADDFIAKPFDIDILLAKIQAMLRRSYDFSSNTSLVQVNDAILDMGNATLIYNNLKIELTKNEFRILEVLMNNKGKVISRETIMTKLWETDSFVDDNTLTVNITRLRKKLEDNGLNDFIKTKKGLGYMVS